MIRYALRCADGHAFESWFASAETFDKLAAAGQVTCAVCGGAEVSKALMAPSVTPSDASAAPPPDAATPASADPAAPMPAPAPMLSAPSSPLEAAIRALRARVEANAEDVGRNFARVAREIHEGEAKARAVYGEATREEAAELLEDGVPVAPLPWTSRRDD